MIEPKDNAYAVGDVTNFTATQVTGGAGNPIARYEWDFGDGSGRVEGRNQSHIFDSAGTSTDSTFTVTLFLTESVSGAQTTCTEEIVVTTSGSPPPPAPPACATPTASFSASAVCDSGEILAIGSPGTFATSFDASASTSGAATESISSFRWSFGDGSSDSGRTVSRMYDATFGGLSVTVTLRVTNSCGATVATSTSFAVVAAACPWPAVDRLDEEGGRQ